MLSFWFYVMSNALHIIYVWIKSSKWHDHQTWCHMSQLTSLMSILTPISAVWLWSDWIPRGCQPCQWQLSIWPMLTLTSVWLSNFDISCVDTCYDDTPSEPIVSHLWALFLSHVKPTRKWIVKQGALRIAHGVRLVGIFTKIAHGY